MSGGRYFVLDGPDGGGKSTQAQDLVRWLQAQGAEVVHLREPGSTPVGEALRQLLLNRQSGDLLPVTEALLFTAARAELVQHVIAPALQRGAVVVAERCYVSTLVYQCLAVDGGLDYDWVAELTARVHGAVLPHAVFVLDVSPETAQQRRRARVDDRFEARGVAFFARVRTAYRDVAARDPRLQVVDADRPREAVQDELRARVRELL